MGSEVERLAKLGLTQGMIANIIGVSEDTLRRRLKKEPELAEALRAGRVNVRTQLTAKLLDQALNKNNVRALLFACKSILGLRETTALEVTGRDGAPLTTPADDNMAIDLLTDALKEIEAAKRAQPDPISPRPDAINAS
ncbi:hypothetical protein [Schaalia hyovaginalis]|uniref:hypothetical protein n=1 Tax=Schaalia hyovaginalis TaxID=29316 RepID=UPI0012B379AC|nr:hypothetical protein [Schaalia hyovaginalis]MST65151.1 hypothetical protein [Schaalia hyovaginalis]